MPWNFSSRNVLKGDMVVHQIILKDNLSESENIRMWTQVNNENLTCYFEILKAHTSNNLIKWVPMQQGAQNQLLWPLFYLCMIKNNTELYLQKTRKLCNVVLCGQEWYPCLVIIFWALCPIMYTWVWFSDDKQQPQFQYREMCHSSGASIFLGTKNIRAWVEIIVSHQCETSFWLTVLGIKEMHKQIHSTNNNFYVCLLLNKIS